MDVSSQFERRTCREADSHESSAYLSPLPDNLWPRQGLRQLSTSALQKVPAVSAREIEGSKGESQSGRSTEGRPCASAPEANAHPTLPQRRAGPRAEADHTESPPELSSLWNFVPRRRERVSQLPAYSLQEVSPGPVRISQAASLLDHQREMN